MGGFFNISCQYFVEKDKNFTILKIACGHFMGLKYKIIKNALIKTNGFSSIEKLINYERNNSDEGDI